MDGHIGGRAYWNTPQLHRLRKALRKKKMFNLKACVKIKSKNEMIF